MLDEKIEKFISNYLRKEFNIYKLPSDASLRKYYRISANLKTYILMDCSKEISSLIPFIQITELLRKQKKIPAPQIYEKDLEAGLLLLEDFGDKKLNSILTISNQEEYYKKMLDILMKLRRFGRVYCKQNSSFLFPENFYDFLLWELTLFTDFYLPYAKDTNIKAIQKEEFLSLWKEELNNLPRLEEILILADYHVDNIMLKNDGSLGIIDYQDALIGSPAYDIVSLLQDARRKIDFDFAEKMLKYYASKTSTDFDILRKHYYTIGIQRNLRILGIFGRKFNKDKDPKYLRLAPLLKDYILKSLDIFKLENKLQSLIIKLLN